MIHEQVNAVSLADVVEAFDPEATASAIASRLLVPSAWLRTAVTNGQTVAELRSLFDVTQPVLMIAILRDRLLTRVRAS
jgi:Zn-dependent peptidase ImmA (M78 family)